MSDTLLAEVRDVFRDFEVAGVPASGEHDPEKARIRELLFQIIGSIAAGGELPPELAADLATVADGLEGKQDLAAALTSLAGLSLAANKLIYATGAGALATADLTAFGRSVVAGADSPAVRTLLDVLSEAQTGAAIVTAREEARRDQLSGVGETVVLDSERAERLETLKASAKRALLGIYADGRPVYRFDSEAGVYHHYRPLRAHHGVQLGGWPSDRLDPQDPSGEGVIDSRDNTSWSVQKRLRITAPDGTPLLDLDGPNKRAGLIAGPEYSARPGSLWQPSPGRLAITPTPVSYFTGRFAPVGLPQPQPLTSEHPVVVYADEDTEDRDTSLYQLAPAVAIIGNSMWVAFVRNNIAASEGNNSYIVLKYNHNGAADWPDADWVEYAYVTTPDVATHMNDVQLWVDPMGRLHILACLFAFTNHLFAGVIVHPKSTRPTISGFVRPIMFGVPSKPVSVDRRTLVSVDIIRTAPLDPLYEGSTICEFDWQAGTFLKVGKLPDEPEFSYPESSIYQKRDGTLRHVQRTEAAGSKKQKFADSAGGDPNAWSQPAVYSALPDNPVSKARFAVSPYTGALYAAFNADAARLNMTLAVSLDDGATFNPALSVLLAAGSGSGTSSGAGSVAYPDIDFDDRGNVVVVWDGSRSVNKRIDGAVIPEASMLAGTGLADKTALAIDDGTP